MRQKTIATSTLLGCTVWAIPVMAQRQTNDRDTRYQERGVAQRYDDSASRNWRMHEDRESRQRSFDSEKDQDRELQSQAKQKTRRGKITGEIVRTKLVDVRGTEDRHQIVLIETERGSKVPIDLGPTQGLKDVQVKTGQDVTAFGTLVHLGERSLIVAEKLRLGNEMISIKRQRPIRQWQGEIANLKSIRLPGADQTSLVARVETDDQPVFVILGSEQKLRNVDLQTGDKIAIKGRTLPIQDRTFVIADQISANGQTLAAKQQGRPSDMRQAQRSTDSNRNGKERGGRNR